MKKILLVSLLVIATILSTSVSAQKIKLVKGDFKFLSGEKTLKVEYVYDGMGVGKFKTEDEYVQKKVTEYNSKEAGKGDNWEKNWKGDRALKYQPKFEELINKVLKEKGVSVLPTNTDAKYTIVVKTTFTEPGWNVGVSRMPASVNFEINFVETDSPQNELAKITMLKVPGQDAMGYDFDTSFRIQEAYAKCGKSLGKYLLKMAYK